MHRLEKHKENRTQEGDMVTMMIFYTMMMRIVKMAIMVANIEKCECKTRETLRQCDPRELSDSTMKMILICVMVILDLIFICMMMIILLLWIRTIRLNFRLKSPQNSFPIPGDAFCIAYVASLSQSKKWSPEKSI